jgi:hypothetical protein
VPYVRTVKKSSGATAVQIVYSSRRGPRQIERLGSAQLFDGAWETRDGVPTGW